MLTDCTASQFQCDSGQCTVVRSMCDGISYCVDGSDQANCSEYHQILMCCQFKVEYIGNLWTLIGSVII